MLAVIFLYLCFTGTMFLNSFIMSTNHYPLFVAGGRIFGSGLILLGLHVSQNNKLIFSQIRQLMCMPFLKYSFFLYTFSAIGFSWGMQYVDPVKACFLFVLSPFITALILYVWYEEQLSKMKIYGLAIGFTAVLPIVFESNHTVVHHAPWYVVLIGYVVFSFAVFSFSYGWILHKNLSKQIHVSSSLITGAALIVGGAISLFLSAIVYRKNLFAMELTDSFFWLLLLFAIMTAISYNMYGLLLKRYSPTFISFASFLEPAFGLLYASIFLGNKISGTSFGALCLLGLGLYLFYQEELKLPE